MAVNTYVVKKRISGITKDDLELDTHQVDVNGIYEIVNPVKVIAENIFSSIENFIDSKYTLSFVISLFNKNGKYKLLCYDNSDYSIVSSVVINIDNDRHIYYYDFVGQIICREIYEVKQIDSEYVRYLVTEHIINPYKGCDVIQQCYVPCFDDLIQARHYYNEQMRHYEIDQGSVTSGFRILVTDIRSIKNSDWYNKSLKAWADVDRYMLNKEDYRYTASIEDIADSILIDAYDELSDRDKASFNKKIYDILKPFIDDSYQSFLDDDLDNACDDEVEEIVDQAIVIALANASSEEEFNNVYDILGDSVFRVKSISHEICENSAKDGYIIVTKDGDSDFYENCYAMNSWSGAEGNPWFGKCQLNNLGKVLCLEEYHPELIAERFPRKMDISDYDMQYRRSRAEMRAKHIEMEFDKNQDGDIICIGTWYCDGILEDKQVNDAMFFKDYGSYDFTDEDCIRLLNGEELVIEHYVSKIGIETVARGKLKDVSTALDEWPCIDFVRTDVDGSKRQPKEG